MDNYSERYEAAALAALIGLLASGHDNPLSVVNTACDIAGLMVRELEERKPAPTKMPWDKEI